MLDPVKLRTLLQVARHGTIAGAAESLGCTPSAASQQLSTLERQVGAQLLVRSSRSVRLTEAGRVLASRAETVLSELDYAERAVADVANLRSGRLRVGAFSSAASLFVIPAMSSFARTFPDVELSFFEIEPEFAFDAVVDGSLDLAVTNQYRGLRSPQCEDAEQTLLRSEQLLLALPPKLQVAADPHAVDLADYADFKWVSTRIPDGFQAVTELACRMRGFEPEIGFRADSYELILEFVSADFGPAIVPESVARSLPAVRYCEIGQPVGLARDVHATFIEGPVAPTVSSMIDAIRGRLSRLPRSA